MSTKVLLFCTILLIVQYTAYGLNCYRCAAGTDGCGTGFSSKGAGVVQISDSTTDGCFKTVSASNNNAISRTNGACSSATTVLSSDGVDGSTTTCCTTDLCNGSTMKSASVSFAFALVALIFFYIM